MPTKRLILSNATLVRIMYIMLNYSWVYNFGRPEAF
ncbi:UNVERIFIED_ORG: hypothetical protein M2154_000896 [Enterobacter sp. JUb101]|nr:hypothetical protein [Lelliottia amnigena]